MNGRIQDDVKNAIQKVLETYYGDQRWPDVLIAPCLPGHMADAAAVVFDSYVASSRFAERETKGEK